MKKVNVLVAAEAYSKVVSAEYRRTIRKYSTRAYSEDGMPSSLLGAITVALVAFVLSVVVNFIAYIGMTVYLLGITSGVIPAIVLKLGAMNGGEASSFTSISVTNVESLNEKIYKLADILATRTKAIKHEASNKDLLSILKSMVDPDILKSIYNGEKMFSTNIALENDTKSSEKFIKDLKYEYKIRKDSYSNVFNDKVKLSKVSEVTNYILKYRDALSKFDTDVLSISSEYFKEMNNKLEVVKNVLEDIKKKDAVNNVSISDALFINYAEALFPILIKDANALVQNIKDIKDELIANIVIMIEK